MIDKLKAKFREAIFDGDPMVVAKNIDRLLEGAKVVYTNDDDYYSLVKNEADTHASLVLFNEPIVEDRAKSQADEIDELKKKVAALEARFSITVQNGTPCGVVTVATPAEPIDKCCENGYFGQTHDCKKQNSADQRVTVQDVIKMFNELSAGEVAERIRKHGIRGDK